ncbi:hypothetical protein ACFLS1_10070 [Verrucomicrobiota bacterium]
MKTKNTVNQIARQGLALQFTDLPMAEQEIQRPDPKRAGVALIIVLGLLAVLTLLAVAFAISMRVERVAARNYAHGVRAEHLLQASFVRIMDHIDETMSGEVYPCWAVTNNADFSVPNIFDALPSYDPAQQYPCSDLLTGEALTNVPGSLLGQAQQCGNFIYWKNIVDSQGKTNGRVSYLVINQTGLVDANYLGGGNSVSNSTTNMITDLTFLDPGKASEISDGAAFIADRDKHVRYESITELAALQKNNLTGPVSNMCTYSFDPDRNVWFLSRQLLGHRHAGTNLLKKYPINAFRNFVTPGHPWQLQYPGYINAGEDGGYDNSTNQYQEALDEIFWKAGMKSSDSHERGSIYDHQSGVFGSTYSGEAIMGLYNYFDRDRVPHGTAPDSDSNPTWEEVWVEEVGTVGVPPYEYKLCMDVWYYKVPKKCEAGEFKAILYAYDYNVSGRISSGAEGRWFLTSRGGSPYPDHTKSGGVKKGYVNWRWEIPLTKMYFPQKQLVYIETAYSNCVIDNVSPVTFGDDSNLHGNPFPGSSGEGSGTITFPYTTLDGVTNYLEIGQYPGYLQGWKDLFDDPANYPLDTNGVTVTNFVMTNYLGEVANPTNLVCYMSSSFPGATPTLNDRSMDHWNPNLVAGSPDTSLGYNHVKNRVQWGTVWVIPQIAHATNATTYVNTMNMPAPSHHSPSWGYYSFDIRPFCEGNQAAMYFPYYPEIDYRTPDITKSATVYMSDNTISMSRDTKTYSGRANNIRNKGKVHPEKLRVICWEGLIGLPIPCADGPMQSLAELGFISMRGSSPLYGSVYDSLEDAGADNSVKNYASLNLTANLMHKLEGAGLLDQLMLGISSNTLAPAKGVFSLSSGQEDALLTVLNNLKINRNTNWTGIAQRWDPDPDALKNLAKVLIKCGPYVSWYDAFNTNDYVTGSSTYELKQLYPVEGARYDWLPEHMKTGPSANKQTPFYNPLATAIKHVIHETKKTNLDLAKIYPDLDPDNVTQTAFVSEPGSDDGFLYTCCRKTLELDILAQLLELVSFRNNLFTVIVGAQVLHPNNNETVVGEKRAVATVYRDAYTGKHFIRSFKWLNE